MIREFNKKWEQDYPIKTVEAFHSVTDRGNDALEKNAKRVCDSQTTADIEEAMGEGGGYDDEEGEHGEEGEEERKRRELVFFEKLSVFNNQYDVALTRAPIIGGKKLGQNFPFALMSLRRLTSEFMQATN